MSDWTPRAGMLVEDCHGGWHVAEQTTQRHELPQFVDLDFTDGGRDRLMNCKPLAPAVTPGGLWDALKGLPGACFADGFPAAKLTPMDIHSEVLILPLEDCQLLFWQAAPGFPIRCQFNPNTEETEMSEQESYEARGRDWQREGAIRAYVAQAGWEVGE